MDLTIGDCLDGDGSNSATVVKNIVGNVRGCEGSSREHKREKSNALRDGGHCNERGRRRLLLVLLKGSTGDFIVGVKIKILKTRKTADSQKQEKNVEEPAGKTNTKVRKHR